MHCIIGLLGKLIASVKPSEVSQTNIIGKIRQLLFLSVRDRREEEVEERGKSKWYLFIPV